MKRQLFLFALSLLAALPALAEPPPAKNESAAAPARKAKKKKKADPDSILSEQPREISIPMARGELQAEVEADVVQRERANAPRTQWNLGISSWKPARVTTGSRIANATAFQAKSLPAADASFLSPLAGRFAQLEFGLGFLALERNGTIEASGIRIDQAQNGYLASVRIGLQATPWLLFGDRLVPYAAAAALPTMLMTRASAFDDGVSDTGVAYELGAGALVRLSKPLSLDLGARQVWGRVQDSDLKGFGLRAGLRFRI